MIMRATGFHVTLGKGDKFEVLQKCLGQPISNKKKVEIKWENVIHTVDNGKDIK